MIAAATPRKRQRRPADSWTPARLATRYGVNVCKIHAWIASGELKATNIASRLGGRPQWIVTPEQLSRFEAARSSAAVGTPQKPAKRRKPKLDYVEYV